MIKTAFEIGVENGIEKTALKPSTMASAAAQRGVSSVDNLKKIIKSKKGGIAPIPKWRELPPGKPFGSRSWGPEPSIQRMGRSLKLNRMHFDAKNYRRSWAGMPGATSAAAKMRI
jgi:hypothetical protein